MSTGFRDIHSRMKALAARQASEKEARVAALQGGAVEGVLSASEHFRRREAKPDPPKLAPELGGIDGAERRTSALGTTIVRRLAFAADRADVFGPRFTGPPAALPAPALTALSKDFTGDAPLPIESVAFLDTETTGLAGGTGTLAFLIAVGWWEGPTFHLGQFLVEDFAHEADQLARLEERLSRFAAICTYNGRTFDIPLLRSRYLLARRRPSVLAKPQLDLLGFSRRMWRGVLPSCSLKNVEAGALRIDRGPDIDGAQVPALFFEAARSGRLEPLVPVLAHNAQDVVTLGALLPFLSQLAANPLGSGLVERWGEWAAVARWLESTGRHSEAAEAWTRAVDRHDGRDRGEERALLLRLARAHKRGGQWEKALATWNQFLRGPVRHGIEAWIELAKYHERVARDPAAALSLVGRGLRQAQLDEDLAHYSGSGANDALAAFRSDFQQRQARLRARLARLGASA